MFEMLTILDGNHLAYRAHYKFMNLKTLDGVKTGVVYGMPYVSESIIRRLGPHKVIIVFDGGRSEYRKSLLPDYKEREKKLGFDAEDFFRQKDIGRDIFMALGLEVVHKRHFEADDLIAMITRRYIKKGWQVIIVSGDKDFNQLIQKSPTQQEGEVSVFNTGKNKLIDYLELPRLVGYKPEQTVDYLCLTGDKSDKIPGYPGIGPHKALKLLTEFGSIKSFLKSDEKFGKVDKVQLKEIWKLNRKLIDLKHFYRKFLIKEPIPFLNPDAKFDEIKLKRLCAKYEINSFLKPQFINTFKLL